MDFDEYEYLEKTVEETSERDVSSSKKSKNGVEKSHRRRGRSADDDEIHGEDDQRRKKSRGEGVNEGGSKRDHSSRSDRLRSSKNEGRERDRRRSSRDGDRDYEGDREKREKDRDRRYKETDIDRDREKDRERRDRDKEKETRERERESRSRSHSSRRHGIDREREREILRERERELELRETRRFKDKKEAAEPEADPERDQRTVFAYQMPLKADERDVYEFFSKAGKVRDVRLIMDRNSRRSKGVGYIEFYDAMSVPMAIALSGQLLLGQPVMVKPSEAEKNLVQSTATVGGSVGPYGAVDRKLYVGNLHFNMTEFQLKQIFEAFGPVELVQLPTDPETGYCKGFGFVQFSQLEHAKAAQGLNGTLEIAGRVIKVSSVADHVGLQESGAKAADFDDDDGGGLSLNAQSRALLMQKLDRSGVNPSVAGSLGVPVPAVSNQPASTLPISGQLGFPAPTLPALVAPVASEPIGKPSECLLLKNMFDPNAETDPEFELDIKEDVEEECSKYGRVKHIYVDRLADDDVVGQGLGNLYSLFLAHIHKLWEGEGKKKKGAGRR